jgi:hypothetical protein
MKCALTKIVPFILTLFVGLALGNFSWRPGFLQVGAGQREVSKDVPYSRTPLMIHYRPLSSIPQKAAKLDSEPCRSASVRVRFEANGKVSQVTPEHASAPEDDCVAATASAARQIIFTPASENGKPLSVVATVSYCYSYEYLRVVDKKGRVSTVPGWRPVCALVEIVSVEGAKETESWRVIYE